MCFIKEGVICKGNTDFGVCQISVIIKDRLTFQELSNVRTGSSMLCVSLMFAPPYRAIANQAAWESTYPDAVVLPDTRNNSICRMTIMTQVGAKATAACCCAFESTQKQARLAPMSTDNGFCAMQIDEEALDIVPRALSTGIRVHRTTNIHSLGSSGHSVALVIKQANMRLLRLAVRARSFQWCAPMSWRKMQRCC
jgi:hypothetical protein